MYEFISHLIFLLKVYAVINLIAYLAYFLLSYYLGSKKKNDSKKNVCLIVAHPDDECMFFAPTILHLMNKHKPFILCLTNGNYYGIGKTREKELAQSCVTLFGSSHDLTMINEPNKILDHPDTKLWDKLFCKNLIETYLEQNAIDILITFDKFGVSGHTNHCIINEIIKDLTFKKPSTLVVYELITKNILRKYSFIFDIFLSLVLSFVNSNLIFINSPFDYLKALNAMFKHKSQLCWFRYLYLFSSSYLLINNLKKL